MAYEYSAITRVLIIQHNGRIKTYRNISLYGIEDCIQNFVNS